MRRTALDLTLDDLFGPDLDAELESARRALAKFESCEERFLPPGEQEAYEALLDDLSERAARARTLAWERLERSIAHSFFHIRTIVLDLYSRPTCPIYLPQATGVKLRFRVVLFPTLGVLMEGFCLHLRDSAWQAEEELEILFEEFSEALFAKRQNRLILLGGIARLFRELRALLSLPVRASRPASYALRDLVAELRSPSILAAGGGSGSFILRI